MKRKHNEIRKGDIVSLSYPKGFVYQTTHAPAIVEFISKSFITFRVPFDGTYTLAKRHCKITMLRCVGRRKA